jgi:hypothetical protein
MTVHNFVGFEVLTAVVMKSSIFWDITPCTCSPLKVNRRFGGTCCLHLQVGKICHTRNQRICGNKHSSTWLIIRTWRQRRHVPAKRRSNLNGPHGVMSQKIDFSIILFMPSLNSMFTFYISSTNKSSFEEYQLLGYDAVLSVEFQPTFRRNISPPSKLATCLLVGFC